jgi:hypothetical protein
VRDIDKEADYRYLAETAQRQVEDTTELIRQYASGMSRSLGIDGISSVVSQQLSKDIAFMDAVADRNRYIQLATMYATMALMYK